MTDLTHRERRAFNGIVLGLSQDDPQFLTHVLARAHSARRVRLVPGALGLCCLIAGCVVLASADGTVGAAVGDALAFLGVLLILGAVVWAPVPLRVRLRRVRR